MWAQRQVGYNFLDQVDVTRLHSIRLMSTKKKTSWKLIFILFPWKIGQVNLESKVVNQASLRANAGKNQTVNYM